jgi:glutathione S-transferase
LKLYTSKTSPFARKVRISAMLLGLDRRIELIDTDANANPPGLHAANPLGQIPTLVTEDGFALFDSAVICEYLNDIAKDLPIIPAAGAARWIALRLQALADGIMDAAVLRRKLATQTNATEDQVLAVRQKAAMNRGLDVLETHPLSQHIDIGVISVVCALGFLDLRFRDEPWREERPALAAWYEKMLEQDCIRLTDPHILAS